MPTHVLRKLTGWAALIAGCLEVVALVFLIFFFALELPQGSGSALRFGYLSDVTPIIAAPINLVVVGLLFLLQRKDAPGVSLVAAALGTTGILMTAWTNIRFVSREISLERQIQLFYMSMAFLGSWHILISVLARRNGFLPSRLATFGMWVGIGQLAMFGNSWILGGYEEMVTSNFEAITQNVRLLVSLAIAVPMALVGFLGAPLWLLWFGRILLREDTRMSAADRLDSPQKEAT